METKTISSTDQRFLRHFGIKLLDIVGANVLVQQGNVWRFNLRAPLTGFDINRTYSTRDEAVDALVMAIAEGYRQQPGVAA